MLYYYWLDISGIPSILVQNIRKGNIDMFIDGFIRQVNIPMYEEVIYIITFEITSIKQKITEILIHHMRFDKRIMSKLWIK